MIAAVVLAAGESRRFGGPKQLARYHGQSLLRRSVDAALGAGCDPVVVVLGAEAQRVRGELDDVAVQPVVNDDWASGMASSIRTGVEAVRRAAPDASAVLLMVCDQLRVDEVLLRRICQTFDGTPGHRVACAYEGTFGVPALFERSMFDDLEALRGARGARPLLERDPDRLSLVPFDAGGLDVDHPRDM